ncbi:MAG TPA: hypothetical protein VNM92_13815 [Thermoanaerobaculia bacterium]|nr:hypothetical protein [Thermoanaerobaculia bacterium]
MNDCTRCDRLIEILSRMLDLGSDPAVSESECARLRGCSVAALRRERREGRGPIYLKGEGTRGAVSYRRSEILIFMLRQESRKSSEMRSPLRLAGDVA